MGVGESSFLVKIDPAGNMHAYPTPTIWNITPDPPTGKLWLATEGKGLGRMQGEHIAWFNTGNSLIPGTFVSDVLIDQQGNKWLATLGGLVYTDLK
jgi:ligand-binding sensor domain-containing protein